MACCNLCFLLSSHPILARGRVSSSVSCPPGTVHTSHSCLGWMACTPHTYFPRVKTARRPSIPEKGEHIRSYPLNLHCTTESSSCGWPLCAPIVKSRTSGTPMKPAICSEVRVQELWPCPAMSVISHGPLPSSTSPWEVFYLNPSGIQTSQGSST